MRADSISDVIGNVSLSEISQEIPQLAAVEPGIEDENLAVGEDIQEIAENTEKNQEGETHA